MFDFDEVQGLRDGALIERLTQSVRWDRRLTVRLLIEIGEVQARGLYRELGFSSMFDFAMRKLGMSEAEAWLRTRVAKLAREVPVVLEMLSQGEVTVSTLALLAPRLSAANIELLHAARGKSKREVEVLLASRYPKPDAPDSVRRLPSVGGGAAKSGCEPPSARPSARAMQHEGVLPLFAMSPPSVGGSTAHTDSLALPTCGVAQAAVSSSTASSDARAHAATSSSASSDARAHAAASSSVSSDTRAHAASSSSASTDTRGQAVHAIAHASTFSSTVANAPVRPMHEVTRTSTTKAVEPLSTGRYKISFTGSERVRDLLREAQELRGHRDVAGELEPLFERALELLVAEEKKRKFALTPQPRAAAPVKRTKRQSRYIPYGVRREVWRRHDGRCSFVAEDGQRCQARRGLEFHHVVPFARGGSSRPDNIELLCKPHNLLQAERDYGRAFMRFRMRRDESGSSGTCSVVIPQASGASVTDRSGGRQQARAP